MPDHRLAHIIHQTAKFLVSLLEKEYGFGRVKRREPEFTVARVDVYRIEQQD